MFVFFFNDTATTEIYPFSLHDALPICGVILGADDESATAVTNSHVVRGLRRAGGRRGSGIEVTLSGGSSIPAEVLRSEEHTSELQSRQYLVCRLLLEKKKKNR